MKNLILVFVLLVGFSCLGAAQLHAEDNPATSSQRGIDMPNPLGVGMAFYNQSQPYQMESMNIQAPGVDSGALKNLAVDNETNTFHLRIDYWLLPFLNVFGIVGSIDSSTKIGLSGAEIDLPITLDDLIVDLDGTVYGGGLVVAYGGRNWFGAISTDLTETTLKEANSSVSAWVLTPKVGRRFGRGAAWMGAMYQNAEEEHGGVYNLPNMGEVPYQVTLREEQPWNFLFGGSYGFSKHWLVTAQGGVGDRISALAMAEYRF